jgi:hypothetical protein
MTFQWLQSFAERVIRSRLQNLITERVHPVRQVHVTVADEPVLFGNIHEEKRTNR